jgi:hypothetical protein
MALRTLPASLLELADLTLPELRPELEHVSRKSTILITGSPTSL